MKVSPAPIPRAFAYVRIGAADRMGRKMCRSYLVPVARDGEKVEVETVDEDPLFGAYEMRFEATLDAVGHVHLRRCVGQSAQSPDMWFVQVDDSAHSATDTRSLVGFASHHFPDGTIIDEMEFVTLPVSNEEQIAAIQWQRSTGEVQQIYVSPQFRRSDVGIRMGQTAGAYHQVSGWQGVVHASSKRTALGQSFALGKVAPTRVTPHTELAPPMD